MGVLTTAEVAKTLSELFVVKELSSDLQSHGKSYLKNQISMHKEAAELKATIEVILEKKRIQNEKAPLDEEIDFQGLCDYLKSEVFVNGFKSFLVASAEYCEGIKRSLLDRAEKEAKGKTEKACDRAKEITIQVFDALYSFFRNQIPQSDLLVGRETGQTIISAKEDILEHFSGVPNAVTRQIRENAYSELCDYLNGLLIRIRNNHPSFILMEKDALDERLFPGVEAIHHFTPCGSKKSGDPVSPVWDLIIETWSEPVIRNVVIEGRGGIGKTVTLLSVTGREDGKLQIPTLYIPLFDLVGDDGKNLTITEYLAYRLPERKDEICLLAANSGHCPSLVLLLDGFNEIPVANRIEILEKLRQWQIDHPGVQYIAVSRPLDGLNLARCLGEDTITIELAPLEKSTVQAYLQERGSNQILPPEDSTIWDFLIFPMFLTLFIKASNLNISAACGYALAPKDTGGPGGIIWNYMQRELLRIRSEKWIIRCSIACEYILPRIAYEMMQNHRFSMGRNEICNLIRETALEVNPERLPEHLREIFNLFEDRHPGVYPQLEKINFIETILQEIGLIIEYRGGKKPDERKGVEKRYTFLHQNFRDCLAGVYLLNLAEATITDEVPETWNQSLNHLALNYVAELVNPEVLDRLWEANRKAMQYDETKKRKNQISTCNLLELYRRNKGLRKELDFSGMDLRGLSLARYLGKSGETLPLFCRRSQIRNTVLNRSVFESEGHIASVDILVVLPDGRVVSGSGVLSGDRNTISVWDITTGQRLQTLKGNTGWTTCAAVFPDGRIIIGSSDCALRVWDTVTGQCLQTLKGHGANVNCVSVLPNGYVVSGSGGILRDDNTLRIWDATTGECVQTIEGHQNCINCVAILPNGHVVSGSDDHTLRVWDPATGQCLQILDGHTKQIYCLSILQDGRIVSGSGDHTLRVWDAATGKCLQSLEGHTEMVNCVVALRDGRVVSASADHTLRVWDADCGRCLHTMEGHTEQINCLSVFPDGRVVSGAGKYYGNDTSIRVWDPATGQCLQSLDGHSGRINCVVALPDGRVVSGSSDYTLRVWDADVGRCLQTIGGHLSWVLCVAVLPDGRVVSSSQGKSLRVWDIANGQCQLTLEGHTDEVVCMVALPCNRVVTGSHDNTLRVWDANTSQCLHILKGHSGKVLCVSVLPDGCVVSGSADNTLRLWDICTGQCRQTFKGHTGPVLCTGVLADGKVISGSSDHTLRVWDPTTGQCLLIMEGHTKQVNCLSVLQNGLAVSGSLDHTLRVWDTTTGQCLVTLEGHTGGIHTLTVCPDGRVVSGSSDNTLRVWDTCTGQCLQTLEGHMSTVLCSGILADGYVISGSGDNTLRVWDTLSGKCLRTLKGHTYLVRCVTVLQDGHVVSGAFDNTLRVWDPNTGECIETLEGIEVNVVKNRDFKMDFSDAILTEDLAQLLWHNGAIISKQDYQRFVAPFQ